MYPTLKLGLRMTTLIAIAHHRTYALHMHVGISQCSPAKVCARLMPSADPNRCDRAFVGNTIGQANAVSDKVLDLRECVVAGKNLKGLTLSGALLVGADL